MPWTSKLKSPLALKDGRAIETLADARAVILNLPEHSQLRRLLHDVDFGLVGHLCD